MLVLLDNGHAGLIDGEYKTSGRRSPVWDDGSRLYEGEFNRAVVARIIEALTALKIPYVAIAPESRDVRLETRVNRANKYYQQQCFYLSIHANAGGGRGFEVYTYPGESKSDKIATIFGEAFKAVYPDKRLRADYSDGDLDKESAFVVLRDTQMPAVLTENFFMDNEAECRQILLTKEGRDRVADFHIAAIQRTQKEMFGGK